jgi:hypothetical protein
MAERQPHGNNTSGISSPPGCETNLLGVVFCDGPIRLDGTFKRCWQTPASYTGGQYPVYVPSTTSCQMVDTNQPRPTLPLGAPTHHIG